MYDTEQTLFHTKSFEFYKTLLFIYPKPYRKRFGKQMLIILQDMYKEEVSKYGKASFRFWLYIFLDTIQSIVIQHVNSMKQQGVKKYFHINNYNIWGGILLLPFALLFIYGIIGRIVQGDLNHYNRSFQGVLSHSFIYANYFGKPLILLAIAIIFPTLAVVINLIPLLTAFVKAKKRSPIKLFQNNPIAVLLTLVGLFFLLIIFGHDVIPCIFYGLAHFGFGQLGHILAVCKNA